MTTKGVEILWKTYRENNRIVFGFVSLGCLWGSILETRSSIQDKIRVFGWLRRALGCFLDACWMLFGSFVGASGKGAAEIAG